MEGRRHSTCGPKDALQVVVVEFVRESGGARINLIVVWRLPIPSSPKRPYDHIFCLSTSTTELMVSQDFGNRNKLVLFDVDDTLSPARQVCLINV